jgi:LuxR family maltose regulon positive regulatory protein
LAILKEELAMAQATNRQRRVLKLRILQAEALHGAGRAGEGDRVLRQALFDAAADGQVRLFADEGRPIGLLIERLGESGLAGVPQEFIGRILRAMQDGIRADVLPEQEDPAAPDGGKPLSEDRMREPLTDREIDVLRLLADGHPNRLLAEKLFVSETTVKAHLRNINAKLNARNRTDAVNIGRRAGLI